MRSEPRASLGAFDLIEPIRRGGMAEVWRGVHRDSGTAVAVKLVVSELAQTRALREALRNEVRAMARLDHPGVVRVHDYGQISEEAAEASGGRVLSGSPYLVMTLAEGGTLKSRHVESWTSARRVLAQILAALAHAHSRAVIHRDVKPSNVLMTAPETCVVSDFGIAHALSRRGAPREAPAAAGTPWFMASEQILGLHRDEGPWTDLYAVGCLAFLIITGSLPFPGADRESVYKAHCLAEPPRLAPRFAVPRELETWIRVLLGKRPRDRFALAADAMRALADLGEAKVGPSVEATRVPPPELEPTYETANTSAGTARSATTELDTGAKAAALHAVAPRPEGRVLEMRAPRPSFDTPFAPARHGGTEGLSGIGLGVHGLRTIPLAGREAERSELFDALAAVWRGGRPRVVELRGSAGRGKTRLAEWLAERSVETGAAHVLWTSFEQRSGVLDGLPRMILRHLSAEGLERSAIAGRLAHHPAEPSLDRLVEVERARLLDLLAPDSKVVMQPAERFAVVQPLLAALGATRPVVVVFDDAQHGREAIAFADHLCRLELDGLPVLVVLTIKEEALEERPVEAEMLDALRAHEAATRIELGRLDASAHAELIGAMLGLEEGLARRLAERTDGNPLFAVQLVGDWVERGELVVGEHGFELRAGASPELPDNVHELWTGRIERLLARLDEELRDHVSVVLELISVLGRHVETDVLHAACEESGAALPEGLLDRLASHRLASVDHDHVVLVHAMLGESLERRAREAGRWAKHNGACARALLRSPIPERAERIGRHLVAAGKGIEAAPWLGRGVRHRIAGCDFDEARALTTLLDEGLEAAQVPAEDWRRGQGRLMRTEVAVAQARLDEAEEWLERIDGSTHPMLAAHTTRFRARIALKRARNEEAARAYEDALALMTEIDDEIGIAHCLHGLGEAEKLLGRLEESIEHHLSAGRLFDERGHRLDAVRTRLGVADVLRRMGRTTEAVEILERAVAETRRMGNAHAVAVGVTTLGDIARAEGRLDDAEAHYREGLAELASLASEAVIFPRLNLCLVEMARGRYSEAAIELGRLRGKLEDRRGYLAFFLAGIWVCEAGLSDWGRGRQRHGELTSLLRDVPVVDDDLAWCFEEVARLAGEADQAETRDDALDLAAAQRSALAPDSG